MIRHGDVHNATGIKAFKDAAHECFRIPNVLEHLVAVNQVEMPIKVREVRGNDWSTLFSTQIDPACVRFKSQPLDTVLLKS